MHTHTHTNSHKHIQYTHTRQTRTHWFSANRQFRVDQNSVGREQSNLNQEIHTAMCNSGGTIHSDGRSMAVVCCIYYSNIYIYIFYTVLEQRPPHVGSGELRWRLRSIHRRWLEAHSERLMACWGGALSIERGGGKEGGKALQRRTPCIVRFLWAFEAGTFDIKVQHHQLRLLGAVPWADRTDQFSVVGAVLTNTFEVSYWSNGLHMPTKLTECARRHRQSHPSRVSPNSGWILRFVHPIISLFHHRS